MAYGCNYRTWSGFRGGKSGVPDAENRKALVRAGSGYYRRRYHFYTEGFEEQNCVLSEKYLVEEKGINYEFISVDHAVLIGSALAGLTGN